MAEVAGFEPAELRSQSPLPYHLATPQNIRIEQQEFHLLDMWWDLCLQPLLTVFYPCDQHLIILHIFFMLDIFKWFSFWSKLVGLEPIPLPCFGSMLTIYTKLLITATLYSQCIVAYLTWLYTHYSIHRIGNCQTQTDIPCTSASVLPFKLSFHVFRAEITALSYKHKNILKH